MDGLTEEELEHARKIIKLTFIKIGIRCDMIGYSYLCYAVELVLQKPELIHSLCKGLYAQIGEHFKVTKFNSVERSIRSAIDNTAFSKSFVELNKMFGANLYDVDEKPTAGELIRLAAEYYLLELYKTDPTFVG